MTDTNTPVQPRMPGSRLILILDHERPLLDVLATVLRREGFVTVSTSTGKEALQWLSRHAPDLMLLDPELPDIPGLELLRRLQQLKRNVPFIVIAGQGNERVAVDMMKRGAMDYIFKDVDFHDFLPEVVRRALAQLDRERKLAQAEEALRRSEANLARAQQIAHLGSYDIHIPFRKDDYRSDEIFRIIGLSPRVKELSTEDYIQRFVHPADRDHLRGAINRCVREARPFEVEYRVIRPDGTVRYVLSAGEPVLDQARQVTRLVGTLLDITERKSLENALLEISDREQRRIGQDLHDGLGQHLAGIELMSRVLEQRLLGRKLKAEAARAGKLAADVRDAIGQARLLARGLAPVVLESEGLMSALEELAENTGNMFKIVCRFRCGNPVPIEEPGVATHLYRIAQEAVFNAVKHGKARRVTISLQSLQDRVRLAIKDDGKGLPRDLGKHKGMGLRIMRYRANMVGGSLTVQPEPGGGTVVLCSIQRPVAR